jgi:hypothetical protein
VPAASRSAEKGVKAVENSLRKEALKFVEKYGQTFVTEQIVPICDNVLTVELVRATLLLDQARWVLSLPLPPQKEVEKIQPKRGGLFQRLRRNKRGEV